MRLVVRLIALSLFALIVLSLVGCDPNSWNKPNNGADVPPSYGPCGAWIDCGADAPKAERCCYPTTKCWTDKDGSLACVGDSNYDPSNPIIWGKKAETTRFKRLPAMY